MCRFGVEAGDLTVPTPENKTLLSCGTPHQRSAAYPPWGLCHKAFDMDVMMVPAGCQGHVVRPSHLTGKHRASLVVRVPLVKSNNSPPTSLTGCRVVSLGFGIKKK